MEPNKCAKLGPAIDEDWNVSSVNTIQVQKRKKIGMCLV
jgi:hypothetical protein